MMDLTTYGILGYLLLIILIVFIRVFAVIIVAGAIASYLGLSGILWWAAAIVIFMVINAIIRGIKG